MEKVEPTPGTSHEASAASVEQTSVLRNVGRQALRGLVIGTFGSAIALGVGNRGGVDSTVGGAEVTTKITFDTDSPVTVESAPISLKFDHQTGIPFVGAGVNITNINIPSSSEDASQLSQDQKLTTENIVKSMGVLEDPTAVANKIVTDYEREAEIWIGTGFLGGLAVLGTFDFAGVTIRRHKKAFLSMVSAGTIGATSIVGYQPTAHYNAIRWNHLGIQVAGSNYTLNYTGALGEWAADQYITDENIYSTIQKNLTQTLGPIAADDRLLHPDEKKINVFSDWHCNIGMARNIATIDKTMGVNATINAGDNALGGTSQESLCADIMTYNLKDTAGENYLGPGNHDFDFMIDEFKKDGVQVMNGKMVTIDGVKVMGFEDPTTSPAGVNTIHSRNFPGMNEDQVNALVERFKQDATEKTCKENPAILIIHELQETTTAAMNCATLTINGHTHVVQLPRLVSPDHTVVNDGTIGGIASEKQGIVNTLGKEATSYIIYIADGQPVGLRLITIEKDGSVEVSEYLPVPHPVANKQSAANDTIPLPRTLPGQAASPLVSIAK